MNPQELKKKTAYHERLIDQYLRPLEASHSADGHVRADIQSRVLQDLHWYFTIDMRERAPTVVVDEAMAVHFHDTVRKIASYLDFQCIADLTPSEVSVEVKHALWSYKAPKAHGPVTADAYDHDQGLVRLSYYIHGDKPAEGFRVDGRPVMPVYSKYRGCNFFRRLLLRQRIVWLAAAEASELEVSLDGRTERVIVGPQTFGERPKGADADEVLALARATYPRGKPGRLPLPGGLAGLKAKALRWMARSESLCRKYANAWVFVDRDEFADDNAEHLYRWVRKYHPEVNAWFMLNKDSYDWNRLQAEGFRLLEPGLKRKLLLLNCDHIISSQSNYELGGFNPTVYGDLMEWRFTFLQHGVIHDDNSHWLSSRHFDMFVTSSPAEHQSIVGDDSPYNYTDRETKRTGMPRHDRLVEWALEVPASEQTVLLVMPTWRGSLVDDRNAAHSPEEKLQQFSRSEYARSWREFLGNEKIRTLAAARGLRMVFLPHPNAVPFIKGFELDENVEVAVPEKTSIQSLFARTAIFVTDYTSVAFTMALLRRPVFYYQFDRESFYGGGHNWRPGYFKDDRDGFGPVAESEAQLVEHLSDFLTKGAPSDWPYWDNMIRAMPEVDNQSCRRVFEGISSIRKRV